MSYLQKSRRRPAGQKRTLVVSVLIFVGILFVLNGVAPNLLSRPIVALGAPLLSLDEKVSRAFSSLTGFFTSKNTLIADNARLESDLADAHAKLFLFDIYLKENADLKEKLGRASHERRVLAAVLQKPPETFYDTLLLDAGENDGVTVGNLVVADDIVLGKITEAYPDQSKAVLFSSAGGRVTVSIGAEAIHKEAVGRGGGNFAVELPKGAAVAKGDIVTLPGLNPKAFGMVGVIESKVTDITELVLFRSPINIYSLSSVEIVGNTIK